MAYSEIAFSSTNCIILGNVFAVLYPTPHRTFSAWPITHQVMYVLREATLRTKCDKLDYTLIYRDGEASTKPISVAE